jgi:hypothetical protein
MLSCGILMAGRLMVAMHTKDVPSGTFRSILRQAKLTEEEFRNL